MRFNVPTVCGILVACVFVSACSAEDATAPSADGGPAQESGDRPSTSDAATNDEPGTDGGGETDGGETDSGATDSGPPEGGGPPVSAGRPGPTNTGVPAGVKLVTSTGDVNITTAGTIIDGRDIKGCVAVRAKNVIIRNTRITCTGYYPLEILDGGSLTIEDSEIAASGGIATSGIAFSNYTARRVNVHGASDGMKADSNVLVEDSWIHDLWLGKDDHGDGIQGTGGSNVTIRRNTIDISEHGKGHGGYPNSCFQVGTENGKNGNWVIEKNWLSGGGWVINFYSHLAGNKIIDNRFSRDYGYGPISVEGTSQVTLSGNVWDDNGMPIGK